MERDFGKFQTFTWTLVIEQILKKYSSFKCSFLIFIYFIKVEAYFNKISELKFEDFQIRSESVTTIFAMETLSDFFVL